MPKTTYLTELDKQSIINSRKEGMSVASIGKCYHINPKKVKTILDEYGLPDRLPCGRKKGEPITPYGRTGYDWIETTYELDYVFNSVIIAINKVKGPVSLPTHDNRRLPSKAYYLEACGMLTPYIDGVNDNYLSTFWGTQWNTSNDIDANRKFTKDIIKIIETFEQVYKGRVNVQFDYIHTDYFLIQKGWFEGFVMKDGIRYELKTENHIPLDMTPFGYVFFIIGLITGDILKPDMYENGNY